MWSQEITSTYTYMYLPKLGSFTTSIPICLRNNSNTFLLSIHHFLHSVFYLSLLFRLFPYSHCIVRTQHAHKVLPYAHILWSHLTLPKLHLFSLARRNLPMFTQYCLIDDNSITICSHISISFYEELNCKASIWF